MNKNIDKTYSYNLAIPGMLLFGIFFIVPTIGGFILSFTHMLGFKINTISFAGIENYKSIIFENSLRKAMVNSFIFTFVSTFFKVVLGMILAILLNRSFRSAKMLRAIFFLPAIINTVAIGLIFTSMMHPTTGLINRLLNAVGLHFLTQNWLTNASLAIFSVAFIEIWKWTGFTMALLLAGLQNISMEYYEAADIDGATGFQKFRYITFPLIMPAFNNALILSLIGGLKVFDLVQATTGGGPGNATQVFQTLIFKEFGQSRFGEGCAASIILAVIIIVIAIPLYKFIAGKEVEA